MKFDKLIELLKEMETTIEAEENQTLLEKLNREELINTMQFLQRCAAQAGYYYNLQAPGSEFGTMKLQTAENDEPIVAQVKIWVIKSIRFALVFPSPFSDRGGRLIVCEVAVRKL